MSEQMPGREALDAARDLTGALGEVRRELTRLNAYGRRNRHLVWLSFASIACDVLLTLLLVFAYGTARNSAAEAAAAREVAVAGHVNLITSCQAGNATRAGEVRLWEHLAAISAAPPHATKAQAARERRQVARLLAYIRGVFAPRDCARVYRLP